MKTFLKQLVGATLAILALDCAAWFSYGQVEVAFAANQEVQLGVPVVSPDNLEAAALQPPVVTPPDNMPMSAEGLYMYAVDQVRAVFGYVYAPHLLSGQGERHYFYAKYTPGTNGADPEEILRLTLQQTLNIVTSYPYEDVQLNATWENDWGMPLFRAKTILVPKFSANGAWSLKQATPLRFGLSDFIFVKTDGLEDARLVFLDGKIELLSTHTSFEAQRDGWSAGYYLPAFYASRWNGQLIVNIGGVENAYQGWSGERILPSSTGDRSIIAEMGDCRRFKDTNLIDIQITAAEEEAGVSPMIWLTLTRRTEIGFRVFRPFKEPGTGEYATGMAVEYKASPMALNQHLETDWYQPGQNPAAIQKFTFDPGKYVIRGRFMWSRFGDFDERFPAPPEPTENGKD